MDELNLSSNQSAQPQTNNQPTDIPSTEPAEKSSISSESSVGDELNTSASAGGTNGALAEPIITEDPVNRSDLIAPPIDKAESSVGPDNPTLNTDADLRQILQGPDADEPTPPPALSMAPPSPSVEPNQTQEQTQAMAPAEPAVPDFPVDNQEIGTLNNTMRESAQPISVPDQVEPKQGKSLLWLWIVGGIALVIIVLYLLGISISL